MTFIAATVTPTAAWLSMDTLAYGRDGAPAALCYKIQRIPSLNAVSGAVGCLALHDRWRASLMRIAFPVPDVARLGDGDGAAATLSGIERSSGETSFPALMSTVIVTGWSPSEGRALGFAFVRDRAYAPTTLRSGHVDLARTDPAWPEYAEITRRRAAAARGEDVAGLHRLLAVSRMRHYRPSPDAQPMPIGGQLVTARVDADGVTISPPVDLPGLDKLKRQIARSKYSVDFGDS